MEFMSQSLKITPPDSFVVRGETWSVLLPRRSALVALAAGILVALAVAASTVLGSSSLTPAEALHAFFGEGTRPALLLIQHVRLPRIVAGLLAGAALGTAGVLTQTMARNRLATPNTLGVNDGAMIAILISLLGTTGTIGPWWVGPVGGLAVAVILLALSGGLGTRGYRVLVMGIALSAIMEGGMQLIMAQQHLTTAAAVQGWSSGSLIGRGYLVAVPVAMGLAVLLPFAMLIGQKLALLRFDEDVAATLGMNVRRVQLIALALAVALAGLAVGICGPIGFIAMAAPIMASRLAGPARVPVLISALVGAALVVVADTLGRVILSPIEVPVGVITSVLGGPFLLWVLLSDKSARRF